MRTRNMGRERYLLVSNQSMLYGGYVRELNLRREEKAHILDGDVVGSNTS